MEAEQDNGPVDIVVDAFLPVIVLNTEACDIFMVRQKISFGGQFSGGVVKAYGVEVGNRFESEKRVAIAVGSFLHGSDDGVIGGKKREHFSQLLFVKDPEDHAAPLSRPVPLLLTKRL